ncbi:cytochrome c oxidase subunit 6b-2-like [Ceratina calcarata]|uniref:Cytochrome c oxidase subunit 6B1 n=1 Tax=Ceratina calcarata TaxID=156304 RepID=A0AAJ7IUF6_9HYME|nr:cytochrome c oxidase subunit 6b-2-like [Ceratina calcarata]XP_017877431.1 cytochrome c oxidase subunit 6b-2-like [Ceratina calcarata]XP_017877433.1 cytochrome c oxidase subunit 6b-2-like [Ceratina calcarata]XP_017877434.1 cytochrome c oxidase subunit 6b-2-like [Ceratina calcarata]XP_017885659.1 cytochrome c oxidase subunit 6b-2-like [Ceratina calcarata]
MVRYTEFGTGHTQAIVGEKLKPMTAPYDPRFPNQNQTRYCFTSFVDFQRCKNRHSEQYEACQYFQKVYRAMCPNAWLEKWEEQLESGTFPAKLD